MAGTPSGPDPELYDNSSMASIMSSIENTISLILQVILTFLSEYIESWIGSLNKKEEEEQEQEQYHYCPILTILGSQSKNTSQSLSNTNEIIQ